MMQSESFLMFLDRDSAYVECTFWTYYIYIYIFIFIYIYILKFLKLRASNLKTASVPPFFVEWINHLTFKYLQCFKFKTKQLHGNGSISTYRNTVLIFNSSSAWLILFCFHQEAEVNTKQAKTFLLFAMIAIIRSFTWHKVNRDYIKLLLKKLCPL